jgi:hypothetical protein
MTSESASENRDTLRKFMLRHTTWWFFPEEQFVHGFLGTGKIFIVGDQPSNDPWEKSHPHRRAFYDLLAAENAGDCHLTDLYKRRGPAGQLRSHLPKDFDEHLRVFRREVELLRPTTIIAMGWDAHRLLLARTPEFKKILRRVWHFGVVRHGKLTEFQARLRSALAAARHASLRAQRAIASTAVISGVNSRRPEGQSR